MDAGTSSGMDAGNSGTYAGTSRTNAGSGIMFPVDQIASEALEG